MAISATYNHIQQKIQREECVVLDGAIACRAQKLYRNHSIANNAMLHTLLIRETV